MPPDEHTYQGSAICNPFHRCHRYLVLILICFLSFGSYFCNDNPAALTDYIVKDMDVSMEEYMTLYSWYSYPNIILSLIGGVLIDRVLGIRLGAIIFSSFCVLGQIVFASGGFFSTPYGFDVMQLGRFIFGIGGESLTVCQNAFSVQWFKGKELNFVFGLQLSISRLGSTFNMNSMSRIYLKVCEMFPHNLPRVNLSFTLYFGALMCIFSLIVAFIMFAVDYRASKIRRQYQVLGQDDKESDEFKWSYLYKFPLQFWLIVIICVTYYCAIFPFVASAKVFFMKKFAFSETDAAGITSTIYVMSAVSSPICGLIVDFTGMNISWLIAANFATIGAHALLGYTLWNPWFAMILFGIGYSLCACALWPMVALVVPEKQLGTAYGIMQAVQNAGLSAANIFAGYVIDEYGYTMEELFFICSLISALTFTSLLLLVDNFEESGLNMSRWSRDRLASSMLEAPPETLSPDQVLRGRSNSQLRSRFYSRISNHSMQHDERSSSFYSSYSRRSILT